MSRPRRILFVVEGAVKTDTPALGLARLMSSVGWDVLVVGRSRRRTGRDWRVEDVQVREIPASRKRARRPAQPIGFTWRQPFAYRDRDARRAAVTRAALQRLEQRTRRGAGAKVSVHVRLWNDAQQRIHRLREAQYKVAAAASPNPGVAGRAPGPRRSRQPSDAPGLARFELALAPVMGRFRPHLIHASSTQALVLAVRAADRQSLRGSRPKVVYDAREAPSAASTAAGRWQDGRESSPRGALTGVAAVIVDGPPSAQWNRLARDLGAPLEVSVVDAGDPRGLGQELDWRHLGRSVDALYRELLGSGPDADLALRTELSLDLEAGRQPPTDLLLRCVRAHLDIADLRLASADVDSATRWTSAAADLLFHRALHFDGATSPLADSPGEFLAGWQGSEVYGRLARRSDVDRIPPHKPVRRIIVATHTNAAFVPALCAELDALDALAVHHLELSKLDLAGAPIDLARQLRARLADSASAETAWISHLQRVIGPADVLWVEWAQRAAVLLSMTDLPVRRRIVRLHSYEAFVAYPHLVDWSRIDDVVFVGPHIRDLGLSVLPALREAGTRTHVIPIGIHAASWLRPKSAAARWTLGLVGWSTPAKDALWALDVLARVRAVDPRFRLRLVGGQPSDASPAVGRYRASVLARAGESDVADAVEFKPQTVDVPGELVDIGFILSSSNREALHLGLIEGAASAAVPVVRDWPLVRRWNGPRRLFPPDWVVADESAAAERILAIAADEGEYAAAGIAAAKVAGATYDHGVVGDSIRQLISADEPD